MFWIVMFFSNRREQVMRTPRKIPAVNVICRHRPDCKYRGTETAVSCNCPKSLRWFRNGKIFRESADTFDQITAREKADRKQKEFAALAAGELLPPEKTVVLLEDAARRYVETKKAAGGITEKSLRRYERELGEFANAMAARGKTAVAEVETADVLAWRNAMPDAANTKVKKSQRVTGFFDYAVECSYCLRNPAKIKSVKLRGEKTQKARVLTDPQFADLLVAIGKLNGRSTDETRRKLRAIALMQRYSGVAVKDAVLMAHESFTRGEQFTNIFLHRAKTGQPVYGILRNEVADEIFSLANPSGKYLIVDAIPENERELGNLVQYWTHMLNRAGKSVDAGFGSHWLRHTFAARLFEAGMPTEDVAALLGDSVETTAAFYSEWISSRQERLQERMLAALGL
jgi:site-specific recombinase XerD